MRTRASTRTSILKLGIDNTCLLVVHVLVRCKMPPQQLIISH